MRGDFSSWRDEQKQNFVGVLHQQGRVLLDADWNAQTDLTNHWQDTAGLDIIGAGVAAIPSSQPNSFQITGAELKTPPDRIELTVMPGRVWADGLLYELDGPAAGVKRVARYLQPPIQDPAATFPTIPSVPVTRDAVILEVWREELSAFQIPELLFEPALGDPDTTERVLTSAAFRLFRLDADDSCSSIIDRLKDNFENKGKLTVTLQPITPSGTPDCPLVEGGGYTGFEHNLYRIEIADVDGPTSMFKWSQYNGGIVGRGRFDSAVTPKTVTVRANLQAVINSGLTACYLEALEFDPSPIGNFGHWRVSYGAEATLGADGVITLSGTTTFGAVPTSGADVFFRLWNGIEPLSDFVGGPVGLQDGILLDFDPVAAGKYSARDYWIFSVRAGEIPNSPTLINNQPPQGIRYHRVPLAELTWTANPIPSAGLEDCRVIFPPLTRLKNCCTYRVGDGVQSHGDFTSIQEAVDRLPVDGGEICVLPGNYEENIRIVRRRNITIKGCGTRSRVFSSPPAGRPNADPVFHVTASQNISIQSLSIEADDIGIGVLIDGSPRAVANRRFSVLPTTDVTLEHLLVRAAKRSAVEVQIAFNVTIRRCRVEMKDVASLRPGIFVIAEDCLIEENVILVAEGEARIFVAAVERRLNGSELISPLDPDLATPAQAGLGGLQLGGTCERIRVINNVIARGIGNGITLGSLRIVDDAGEPVPGESDPEPHPCDNAGNSVEDDDVAGGTHTVSAGDLYDILIERNRIFNMGFNGIGVIGFFDLKKSFAVNQTAARPVLVTVNRLHIFGNYIRRCLGRTLRDISARFQSFMGYAGISLGFVLDLVVRDNFIEENGPDHLQPVCGIFLLGGEGVEISRNVILNNGRRTDEPASSARRGPRGGIFIAACVAPTDILALPGTPGVILANGVPALKVQENIVSAPLGRALTAIALGPVSVVGNQFTSRGMEPVQVNATTVLIINLGQAIDDPSTLKSFQTLSTGQTFTTRNVAAEPAGVTPAVSSEPQAVLSRRLLNGSVLFTNNQCLLQAIEPLGIRQNAAINQASDFTFAADFAFAASIAIISLDDIGFHDNQCECLTRAILLTDVFLLSTMSLRVSDNRFKEARRHAAFSGITLGLLNMTTDNQATHCLLIVGPPETKVNVPNTILNQADLCGSLNELLEGQFK